MSRSPLDAQTSTGVQLFHQLRARGSRIFRHVFGPSSQHTRVQPRPWRPPVSGHGTQRFADLGAHPFASAPLAELNTRSAGRLGDHPRRDEQASKPGASMSVTSTAAAAPRSVAQYDHLTPQHERQEVYRFLSQSQRVLQAASGHPIPVSPQRVQTEVEASNKCRSASMPKSHFRQVPSLHPQQRGCLAPSATVRTVELLEQFPQPPSHNTGNLLPSASSRPLSLSSFPGRNRHSQNREADPMSDGGKRSQQKPRACTIFTADRALNGYILNDDTMQESHPRIASNESVIRRVSVAEADNDDECCELQDLPSVRGQSRTRYCHSGTPIYDNEAASLRSQDQQVEHIGHGLLDVDDTAPIRDTSCETGASRDFSAMGMALGTTAVSHTHCQGQEQERRAVANGALRFGGLNAAAQLDSVSASMPHNDAARNENDVPLTPVTITQAAKDYCPHRLAELQRGRAHRLGLDGTSLTPAPTQLSTVEPTAGPTAPNIPTQQSTTTLQSQQGNLSWGHNNHISRRINKGTWRTRMKKTKCWRCELESRRHDSTMTLKRGCQDFFAHLKALLPWNCFCQYRGYEDESDDECVREDCGEVEERARLGRMGGEFL